MVYLYSVLALAIIALAYMFFEAGFVELKKVVFCSNSSSLKVMLLSDIHINLLRVSPEKVKRIIDRERPDFIVMTGDYISRVSQLPRFYNFLDAIQDKSKKIYLCMGNHDYEAFLKDKSGGLEKYIKDVSNRGITVLHNDSECFVKNSRKYNLIGIADYRRGGTNVKMALNNCCKEASKNIAFSHNPDVVLEIPEGKVDYLFCGHFHGGQIWLPFNLEFKALRHERLCKMGIRRGLYNIRGINLYISRGLGNVLFPLRFLSRPEITMFYI
jgi:predicted MPP superfamily phosphohydrolase